MVDLRYDVIISLDSDSDSLLTLDLTAHQYKYIIQSILQLNK